MKHSIGALFVASLAILCFQAKTEAGSVNLSSGWTASWDNSLDPYVDINEVATIGNFTFIQKSAEFMAGLNQTIDIIFTQTAANAATTFVIEDEIITNSTGVDWPSFEMGVSGANAAFDPASTLASGGGGPIGWTISPYQQAMFGNSDTSLSIFDGTVLNGTSWFPGSGATNGELFIDVTTTDGVSAPFSVWTLSETPTPEPSTLTLLGIVAVASIRRRR